MGGRIRMVADELQCFGERFHRGFDPVGMRGGPSVRDQKKTAALHVPAKSGQQHHAIAEPVLSDREERFQAHHSVHGTGREHLTHRAEIRVHAPDIGIFHVVRLEQITQSLSRCRSGYDRNPLALEIERGADIGVTADQQAKRVAAFRVHRVGFERQARTRRDDCGFDTAGRPIHLVRGQSLVGLCAAGQGVHIYVEPVPGEDALKSLRYRGPSARTRLRCRG